MAFEAARAKECYARSEELLSLIEPVGRPILWAMRAIYGGILNEIERRDFDVFTRRVSLPVSRKMWVALQAYVMHAMTGYSVRLMRLMSFARRIPVGWPIAVYALLGAISGWRNSVALNDLCRLYGTPFEKAAAMSLIALFLPFATWLASVTHAILPTPKVWLSAFPEMHRFNRQSELWLLGAIRFAICGIEVGVIARSIWDAQWYVWPMGFWLLMLGSAQATYRVARLRLLTDEEGVDQRI